MAKRVPTTGTRETGRRLRYHQIPSGSPRFQTSKSIETTGRPTPSRSNGNKKTKKPSNATPSSEDKLTSPPVPAPRFLRRSSRLDSGEAKKSESDPGSSGRFTKEIAPDGRKIRGSRSVEAPQNLRRSSRLASIAVRHMNAGGILGLVETPPKVKRSLRLQSIAVRHVNADGVLGSLETPQKLRRSSRLASSAVTHVITDGVLGLVGEGKVEDVAERKGKRDKRRKVEILVEERKEVAGGDAQVYHDCAAKDWTEEQERALQRAYLLARPTPHFWKKVSKMVPEKSAQECFDRIHANFATPPQHQPRSRAKKADLSPIVHFAFGDKPLDDTNLKIKKARGSKRRTLAAQKTVRHLLRKHQLADQTTGGDYFSHLENSPNASAIIMNASGDPGTPDSLFTTGFLMKCSERSSSTHKRPLSRFKTNDVDPSPEVLKRIKNVALHEKYIDHLHYIEARRRRACHGKENHVVSCNNMNDNRPQSGVIKAAMAALTTEAQAVISHFQDRQVNALDYDDDSTSAGNCSFDLDGDA
ncbi:uncharacterized protein LOC122027403 [Zingiber officinale]|uniref:Myb-like domain-containing protein n=1 Tax=Zingiber officinale TaxID=94328 RepID=A0A8J5C662_ZINOF|nr:uncharacterized protein LOC122027403 [Zingiber officinale]KAG6473875.1 hypothetical protein ZIOFF_067793 [Zingiber officinale]